MKTSPNTFERRNVKLGLSDGLVVEVIEGVELEDAIKIWNKPSFNGRKKKGKK